MVPVYEVFPLISRISLEVLRIGRLSFSDIIVAVVVEPVVEVVPVVVPVIVTPVIDVAVIIIGIIRLGVIGIRVFGNRVIKPREIRAVLTAAEIRVKAVTRSVGNRKLCGKGIAGVVFGDLRVGDVEIVVVIGCRGIAEREFCGGQSACWGWGPLWRLW